MSPVQFFAWKWFEFSSIGMEATKMISTEKF